jgi:hypothetical protein
MIRPLTFICLLSAFGSGLYLYSEKHRAILLDRDIARAIRGTEAARERTGMLRAEWALLNDPGRLQEMADKYLTLKTMAPGQFVQLAELSTRLPPPAPAGAGDGTDGEAAENAPAAPPPGALAPGSVTTGAGAPGSVPADAAPVAAVPPAAMQGAPAPGSPAVVAMAEPVHPATPVHAAARQVAHAAPKKTAHPAAVADREEPFQGTALPRGTPLPLAGLPTRARMMSAMAHASPATMPRPRVVPRVVTATPSAIGSGSYVGSALASGSSLPPPVPLQ